MVCDICKTSEATIHLTQIVDGKVRKVDLCESCAKAKNVTGHPDFSVADLMMGLGASEGIAASAAPDERCAVCGMTAADFKKTGRLGCGECWKTFEKGLGALLKDLHRGTTHVGKVPARIASTRARADQLRALENELKRAVKEERFEEAARLRNQIRALEGSAK
jgi:protein arginine kinase activator